MRKEFDYFANTKSVYLIQIQFFVHYTLTGFSLVIENK